MKTKQFNNIFTGDIAKTARIVTNLRMPLSGYGFRSGYARALVDGVAMQIHTSQSDRTDYYEHCDSIRARFAAGEGDPCPEWQNAIGDQP